MAFRRVIVGVTAAFLLSGCGDGDAGAPIAATATSTTSVATTSTTPTTVAAPTTTTIRRLTTTSTQGAGRTVARSETFSLRRGETVTVAGEALSVTYVSVGADNRCRPGLQCLVAGNATLSVAVGKDGTPAATLALNSNDPPTSARFLAYRVELVQLGFESPPVARLRVT